MTNITNTARTRCYACREQNFLHSALCSRCLEFAPDPRGIRQHRELPKGFVFLTTKPNPCVKPYGYDQGQRGWRLHIIRAHDHETDADVKNRPALCGLAPWHGWSLDMFIDRPCAPCLRALLRERPEMLDRSDGT